MPHNHAPTQGVPDADSTVIAPAPARAAAEIAERCEHIYRTASGDPTCLPWHHPGPTSALTSWLHTQAPGTVRPGARAIVVGCGLGDDVVELAERGYDAVGFDISPTCIDWARQRFPYHAERFFAADLLDPPSRLRARFDLVVEAFTIQSIWPELRDHAFTGVASLAKLRGAVLLLAREPESGQTLEQCECAPYPISCDEMQQRMHALGFAPLHQPVACTDDGDPPKPSSVGAFRREAEAL